MGNVGETNKSHGKRLVADSEAKGQSSVDQDMSVEDLNRGGADRGQVTTQ